MSKVIRPVSPQAGQSTGTLCRADAMRKSSAIIRYGWRSFLDARDPRWITSKRYMMSCARVRATEKLSHRDARACNSYRNNPACSRIADPYPNQLSKLRLKSESALDGWTKEVSRPTDTNSRSAGASQATEEGLQFQGDVHRGKADLRASTTASMAR